MLELYVLNMTPFFYCPRNATEEMRSIFEVLIRAIKVSLFAPNNSQ